MIRLILTLTTLGLPALALTADLPDISSIPPDLMVPPAVRAEPAPGIRSIQTTAAWRGTEAHHTLYIPSDWKPGARHPVIVEFAGNGNYKNKFGDVSTGAVEDSRLGFGVTGGQRFIWLCMPFVEVTASGKRNAVTWWGDVEETKRYCIATVRDVCARFGGDEKRVVLSGFSRGAIACNFIGLHDDEIARLWRGFICHSHYDGVREGWPYACADRASALVRLKRLGDRPQFISHEGSIEATEKYLASTGIKGRWTFDPLPFRNHTDAWTLREIPLRAKVREWLEKEILAAQ